MIFNIIINEKTNLIRLIAGAAVFATGIIFEYFLHFDLLAFYIFLLAFILLGGDIIFKAIKNLLKGQVFDENFLMSIATIGAFIIGEAPEAAAVMMFYQFGEYFQERAVAKSKKSITELMDIRPDYANLKRNDEIIKVAPDTVNTGDIIIVKPGERIPLDGVVVDGVSMLDTSALTGESVPRKADIDTAVLSGCVNLNGLLSVKVTKEFSESTVSKIIELVENSAGKKAPTEKFITKFAKVYTPIVVIIAFFLAILPPLFFEGGWNEWIHRSLIFLVISCPCALVLSIPMSFFAGVGKAAKSGILIKGGNYLEAFNNLNTVVFDKTGTLTHGVFKVTAVQNAEGFNQEELLELAANVECFSNHPIALSVINEYKKIFPLKDINRKKLSGYTEIAGNGVRVIMDGKIILAGNKNLMINNNIDFIESDLAGTIVYITYDGRCAGCITISDEIKPDSYKAIPALKERGVFKTVMLTGDNPVIAKEIAEELGIDEFHGGLLPHEKVKFMEKIKIDLTQKCKNFKKDKLAFIGDGINDAPVLAMADIGIAMGALGQDAAIEAADVVLMTDEPSKIAEVIDIAGFTGKIVRQNIVFVLAIKVLFLVLGALGIASMWEAVFADVGVSFLAVLNAMRIFRNKKEERRKKK